MTVIQNVRLFCLLFFCLPFCVRVCAYFTFKPLKLIIYFYSSKTIITKIIKVNLTSHPKTKWALVA